MIFPNKLKDMLRSDWPCKPTRDVEGDHLIPDNSYTVYYRSPSEAMPGDPSSFSLQARPNQYAESGVRSYYVDEDGVLPREARMGGEMVRELPPAAACLRISSKS